MKITVNIARYETCEYELDDGITPDDMEMILEQIQSGELDPTWSKIRHEDIDIVAVEQ